MKSKEEMVEVVKNVITDLGTDYDNHVAVEYEDIDYIAKNIVEALCRALPEPKSRDIMYDARRKSYDHTLAGNFYNQLKKWGK